ncbi:SprT family zinc-dependent metalloprotease [soil metagenome]
MSWLRSAPPPRTPPRAADDARDLLLPDGDAVSVRWVRDARARRLRLIVNERGVRLTLPTRASERSAQAFLDEHRGWLAAQLAQRPVRDALPFSPDTDHALLLRGQWLPLAWQEGRYLRLEQDDHGIVVHRPARASLRQLHSALKDFYLQQARRDVGQWLPKYLATLPRAHSVVRLRPLASLWGSLSPTDALSLDLSLVLGRPSAFEYVLVHELCHLLHRDHSRRFWREVEARWPQWRDERCYLHTEGMALKSELLRYVSG